MNIAHKITLIALLWLILVNPGSITNPDTLRRSYMAHAWWTQTEEAVPQDKLEDRLVIHVNNRNYVPYDLGQSMLMLPGDWLGTKLSQSLNFTDENESQQFREAIISFVIFLPINLLAILTSFKLLRYLGYCEKLAGLSSIVLLLGTTVLFYASFHQQNNQILFFVLASYQTALAYVIQRKKRLAIASGMALGVAFLIRITSILYVVSVLTFLIGCLSSIKVKLLANSLKSILLWMTGFIPFVFLERVLTYYRYGSWMATSTSLHLQIFSKASKLADPNTIVRGENSSFFFFKLLSKIKLEGLSAPLFSPEKSIFIYDPLLLPCLILGLLCWRFLSPYIRWYIIAGIIGFLLHLYLYSWTAEWLVHRDWGARYHLTSIHLLLVPLLPLIVRGAIGQSNNRTNTLKIIFSSISRIIIVLAILCQLASISLSPAIETTQQRLNIGSQFRIIQRLNNIFYMFNYEDRPHIQMSKVQEQLLWITPEQRMTWNILPFKYQIILGDNSSFKQLLPLLWLIWSLIFILAVIGTIWIIIE